MTQSMAFSRAMIGKESTYGTAVSRTAEVSKLQSGSVTERNNNIYERSAGAGLNVHKVAFGIYEVDWKFSINVNDFDIFKYWIGQKSGAGSAGDPYILTEATDGEMNSTNGLDSFCLEVINTTESSPRGKLIDGCVGNDFSINGSVNSLLSATLSGFGHKTIALTSATSYTEPSATSYIMFGGGFKFGTTPSSLPGIRSFTLNYTNGINKRDFYSATSRLIESPVLGSGRGYTGTLSIRLTNALAETIETAFYGQTSTSGPLDNGTSVPTNNLEFEIDIANGSNYATIWLDQANIDEITDNIDIGGGLRLMTFRYTALYGKDNYPIRWWSV